MAGSKYHMFGYQVWPWIPDGFKIAHIRYYMTVEPLAFIAYLGLYAFITVQPQLQVMRMTETYQDTLFDETGANHGHNTTYKDFGNYMQTQIISWNQYRLAVNIPSAILMGIFLGAWSDKNGRQINILMGIAALMMGFTFAQSILYSYAVLAPLWTWIVMTGLEGCLGNYQLSYFAGQAYQADLCPDKDELTIRMNIVSLMRNVGGAIGSELTARFSVGIGLIMWIAIGNTVIFAAWLYIFFWVVQIPAKSIEKARNEYAIRLVGDRERVETILNSKGLRGLTVADEEENVPFSIMGTLKNIGSEFTDSYEVFRKPRPGYLRASLWMMTLVGFVSTLAGTEGSAVLGPYTFFALNWGPPEYGSWNTHNIICACLGQFIGIFLLKKVLRFRDNWILNLSLISYGVSQIPIAFPTDSNMYLSNYLQVLAPLTSPTLSSIITSYVEPEEAGRALLGQAITTLLAILGQVYGLQLIYEATLYTYAGTIFWIVTGMTLICCIGVAWCDFVARPKTKPNYAVNEIVEEEIDDEFERHHT